MRKISLIFIILLLEKSCYMCEYIIKIPRINLNVKIAKDSNLERGLLVKKFDLSHPLVILGHSGSGPLALFNNLKYLKINDDVYLNDNRFIWHYKVISISDFLKNHQVTLDKDKFYLITCDQKDQTKQLIICLKLEKITKKS